jgi:hypothetical protein
VNEALVIWSPSFARIVLVMMMSGIFAVHKGDFTKVI